MWQIVYRVIFPGIILAVLLAVYVVKVAHGRVKDEKENPKLAIVLCILIGAFSLGLSAYYSLDLILQDHVVETGEYARSFRGKEPYITELYFETGKETISCEVFSRNLKPLEEGRAYTLTYAKRTGFLLSVE